ncbi:MAG TPA: GNAT family N-acetyltransferase [Aggregatilineales bacterium]|nr:GNAT family N-acetyltransferase [Aggregatilineales bacterium]
MNVRQALLDDISDITEIYRSHINEWQRFAPDGTLIPADYNELTLFERWQHGGAWLSAETCAIWTGYLLQSTEGIPLVCEVDGVVLGHAEVFIGQEAEPYGHHINIATLCVRKDVGQQGIGTALVRYVEDMARVLKCQQVTVSNPQPPQFYERNGFSPAVTRYHVRLPAHEGRVFYKARDLAVLDPAQIHGWYMPLGRYQNARQEWERMRWDLWNGVPQLVETDWHRLFIELTGQPGILHLHQHRGEPLTVTARLWTKNAVSTLILSAVKDRAARLGYTTIETVIDSDNRSLLPDAEAANKVHWVYTRQLHHNG